MSRFRKQSRASAPRWFQLAILLCLLGKENSLEMVVRQGPVGIPHLGQDGRGVSLIAFSGFG